ncbi:MAG: hypothetical protein ACJ0HA_01555 [Dehalococcoidia bacterium]|tara:strand:+ start:1367 stop:1993 length:627 start_codon:yes stop_codon:yes gene_type:complete
MKISWIKDAGIRTETSQGLILFNHDENTLTESSQKDDNTIAIFLNEDFKINSQIKLLDSTKSIFEPGEYEVNNIPIQSHAVKLNTENNDESTNIFSAISEGMTICYLNEISKITIPANVTESIGKIDILICISNDSSDQSVESINTLLSSIDPKILIIVEKESNQDTTEIYSKLIKGLGQSADDPVSNANITKSSLGDTLKVVNLKKS